MSDYEPEAQLLNPYAEQPSDERQDDELNEAPAVDTVAPEPVASIELGITAPTAGQKASSSSTARDRQLIRRTANKTIELTATDAADLRLLAAVLGVNTTGFVDLTVSVMTATARDSQSANDAKAVLDADAIEAGVVATALGRARLRQVWRLFAELGVVSGETPGSEPKAAIALVRAINKADAADLRAQIDIALRLLKK